MLDYTNCILTFCLLEVSADNIRKQFWPTSGPTQYEAKLVDTRMVFLKDLIHKLFFFEGGGVAYDKIMKIDITQHAKC